jgi:hypothetical protein
VTAIAVPVRDRRAAPRTRPVPPRGHLAVVESPRRRHRLRGVLFGLAGVVALALFTLVASHALLAQSQVAIDRLDQETTQAEHRYEQARYAHAALAAPDRIVQRASALGLVAPAEPPVEVAMSGDLPEVTDQAGTLHGWTEVKPTLADPR